jgi:hypothetical protein
MERTLVLAEKILQVVKDSGLSGVEARAALKAAHGIVGTIPGIPMLPVEQQAELEEMRRSQGLA